MTTSGRAGARVPLSVTRAALLALGAALCVILAGGAGAARAAGPPSSHDPCARSGRDSCHTTGVGAYHTNSFGLRWFGDYRRAVAGVSGPTFCIDLNYWFPGKAYRYQQRSAAGLRSRGGAHVSARALHRMAYALWADGRSGDPRRQSATMLYIHSLMPGTPRAQVAPDVIGRPVGSIDRRIASDAARYAGPYTIKASAPGSVTAGSPTTVTLRVRSASGAAVPGVMFRLAVHGANAPATATSNRAGTATVTVTPRDPSAGLRVHAAATVAGNLPVLYVPTHGASARNGQRLIGAATQTLQTSTTVNVGQARPKVSSQATPASLTLGATDADHVTISGLPAGYRRAAHVRLYGPASSAAAIACTGTPAADVAFTAHNGTTTAPAVTPPGPGFYGYRIVLPGSDEVAGVTTGCAPASETFEVLAQPAVHTQASSATVSPGGALHDTVVVSGLAGQTATVTAKLYGPYASQTAVNCQGAPAWTGSVTATGDGTYRTADTTLTTPGYYVYQESIAPQGFVKAAATQCSDVAETTIVPGAPAVHTQVSAATTAPGAALSDHAVVTGLGALSATVDVALYGPYASRAAIDCSGTPAWTGTLAAKGDGTYTTAPVALPAAGYYVYRESIAATAAYPGVQTPCDEAAETTFAHATPTLGTQVSHAAVRPGSSIRDRIKVTGLGKTSGKVRANLYGPFASASRISCGGRPLWSGTVNVAGDGTYTTAPAKLPKAGLYVYRESMPATRLSAAVTTPCSSAPETSLGAPQIITGPGAPVFTAKPAAVTRSRGQVPSRIAIAGLGIDAPIDPVDISISTGDLVIPANIHRVGWWQDGAAPSDAHGTTLLAGHIDWAGKGPGAFYELAMAADHKRSAIGKRVTVTTRDGHAHRYRITAVARMPKGKLPTSIYTSSGARKLVMVTCGGRYDARTHHYLDNVVVTAVPLGTAGGGTTHRKGGGKTGGGKTGGGGAGGTGGGGTGTTGGGSGSGGGGGGI